MMRYSQIPLVKAIPDAILHLKRDGTIVDFKPSLHHPPYLSDSAIGQNVSLCLPESFAEQLMGQMEPALATGEIQTWEYTLPGKHLLHHQEARMMAITADEVVVVVRDITDRKWAEDASRQSEHYYRQLIQNLQVGVLIQAPSGEILLSNQAAEKLLGLSEDALFGRLLTDLDFDFSAEYADAGPEIVETIRQAVTSGDPMENLVVGIYRPQTESQIWLMVNILPERDPAGVLQYVVVTLSDITDYRNAEAALHTSEEQYELLMGSIHEVIFLIDTDGLWSFLNPAWESITGFSLAESIGRRWIDFVHPEDVAQVQNLSLTQHMPADENNDYRREFRLLTRDQGVRWVDMHLRMIRSRSGAPLGFTGILSDITARKLNEEHAIQLAVQSRLLAFQRQLLAHLSHDIRTPLSIIVTNAYLLRRKLENPEPYLAHLDSIMQQVQFLTQALERVTMLTQLIHGVATFRFVPASINNLISQVVNRHRPAIEAKSHLIQLHLDPSNPLIEMDERWMMEVIDHLLRNAIEYTNPHGTITISTHADAHGLMLCVSDSGVGIQEHDLPHIFEPFYKGDKARSGSYGTSGLGLAIVKHVVDAHSGSVRVESVEGGGTTFEVRLPCGPPSTAQASD